MVSIVEQLDVGLARGCQAAANGLDDEAGYVCWTEDKGIQSGANPGEIRVEYAGDSFECEVEGDADDRGRENDGADLQLEGS